MGIQERKEREFRRREREILDAALDLFATDDWQAVTVEQIADRAEIGKGTVYKHFASKDEIYAHLALEFNQQAVEKLERIDPALPVIERLRAVIRLVWEQHLGAAEYRRLVQYCEREDFQSSLQPETQARLATQDARFRALIDQILEDGIRQGVLPRKSTQELVFGPMAALQGALRMMWGHCVGQPIPTERFLGEITNFILAGMLYQEWLADEGLGEAEATRRAQDELREVEAELEAERESREAARGRPTG